MEGGGQGGAAASNAGRVCYYTVLGISKDATASQIKTAYRRLALKWHPDRWAKDPEGAEVAKVEFQKVQAAFEVLSHEGKKLAHDTGLLEELSDADEGFFDFMKEMMERVEAHKANGTQWKSMEDVQRDLNELQKSFDNRVEPLDPTPRKRPSENVTGSSSTKRRNPDVQSAGTRC